MLSPFKNPQKERIRLTADPLLLFIFSYPYF